MRAFRFILILFTGFLYSCIYTENGIYIAEPLPDDPPVLTVTTNLDTMSDPSVIDSLEVVYDITVQNGELYLVTGKINNSVIFQSDTTRNSFWLHSEDVEVPDHYSLLINIYYSTNSNSLGDKVGIEADVKELEYPVWYY